MPLALVVDDDPAVLHMIQRALLKLGWSADAAANAEAALGAFSRRDYALLVCDFDLGLLDGLHLSLLLRRQHPALRVVMISGRADNLERARAAGLGDCLGKPFTLEELAAAIIRAQAADDGGPIRNAR